MSFSIKSLTLLLTAVSLNTVHSSDKNNIQNNTVHYNNNNNIQDNTVQYSHYSNIGEAYSSCIINNNGQNNLNNNPKNTIQNCNTQYNTYSNINRVCNNCIFNNDVINSNMQFNPFFHPYYYFNPINGFVNNNAFYYSFNNLNNIGNISQYNKYNINTSIFHVENSLKKVLLLIRKGKHCEANKCLDKFIKTIRNTINISRNILLNWVKSASELIDDTYNNELIKQKNEIINIIYNTFNRHGKNNYNKIKKTIRELIAINNDEKFLREAQKEFNNSDLKQKILELRNKTNKYYEPVENLKQLLINNLKDKDFSVQYIFPYCNNITRTTIEHLFYSGHIISNMDIGCKKHAREENLIHGIEDIKYYQIIKELIQYTYYNYRDEYEKLYKEKIYNIIQYCLVNPLINEFINDNNQYISTFEINTFGKNTNKSKSAVLCVINKSNRNKLVLGLYIKKNNHKEKNVNTKVINTIKSFYGISNDEYKAYEEKHNNYINTYVNEINK